MLTFLQACILALSIEGAILAIFPGLMRRAMLEAAGLPEQALRSLGCLILATAVLAGAALRFFN